MNFVCPFCHAIQPSRPPAIWFHASEKCHSEFESYVGRLDFTEFSFVPTVRAGVKGLSFWCQEETTLPRWDRVLFGKLENPIKMDPMWSGVFPIDPADFSSDEDLWKTFQSWHYTAGSCGYPVSFLEFQAHGPIHSLTTPVFAHVITGSAESVLYLSRIGARKTLCNPTGKSACILRKANDDQFLFEDFPYRVFPGTLSPYWGRSQIVKLLLDLCSAEKHYQGQPLDYSSFRAFTLTEWRYFSTQNMREPYRDVDFGKKCVHSMEVFDRTSVFN